MQLEANLRLFSYVVTRDFGFAPNPFYGVCTLATCKPIIRRVAEIGDWVVGTGSKRNDRQKFLVFVMRVSDVISYNEYWMAPQYNCKKPFLNGSFQQAYGDNIYFKDDDNVWQQLDSHHSLENGVPKREKYFARYSDR